MATLGILIAGIAVIVLAAHWPVLSARAMSFDDTHYLTENPLVRNPGVVSVMRFLREVLRPSTVEGYYQPLSMISLMLDYARASGPEDLRPFHQTSLALHVLNTSLVILLLHMLFRNPWAAAMAGLLFGVHPLTVETVAWLAERKTQLASFFSLACLCLYVRYARRAHVQAYAACLAMYVLALLSKPTSTPLPVLLLLLDYWPMRRLSWRNVAEKAPFLIVGGLFAVITIVSQAGTASIHLPGHDGIWQVPLVICHNIVFYLWKVVWPVGTAAFYPFPEPLALSNPMIRLGVIGTCALIPAILLSLRWTRAILTGWLFFFVAILPTMGIVGFTIVIAADRFVYLPAVGLLLPLARFLGRTWTSSASAGGSTPRRAAIVAAVAVVATFEIAGTRRCLAHWQDSETLCRYMLSQADHVPILHFNLAGVLAATSPDRLDSAAEEYRKAITLKSDYYEAYGGLAAVLYKQGMIHEAFDQYFEAIKGPPTRIKARILFNMGVALAKQGRTSEAIERYSESLKINQDDFAVHTNLGAALFSERRFDEAIEHFTAATRINPRVAMPHRNLGLALASRGRRGDAVMEYRKSLQLEPDDAEVRGELANVLTLLGRFDDAIEEYRRVLVADPANPQARQGLQEAMERRSAVEAR